MNAEVCYVSPNAPLFTMRVPLESGDRRVKFASKELRLDEKDEAELIAAIDKLIATRPNIASIIHKVDMAAAEEMAKAHRAQLQRQRGTVQGPVSADDAKRAASMAVAERDADLASQGATVEDLTAMRSEMSKDGLEMTENAEGVIAPEAREGFVADAQPEVPADPKSIFANLGK